MASSLSVIEPSFAHQPDGTITHSRQSTLDDWCLSWIHPSAARGSQMNSQEGIHRYEYLGVNGKWTTERDYQLTIVADSDLGAHTNSLGVIFPKLAELATTDEVIAALDARPERRAHADRGFGMTMETGDRHA
jgi:hypothetical protein